MQIHFNGFWDGFHDHTNPNTDKFFLDLMTKVYGEECTVGSFENSDVLIENVRIQPITFIPSKLKAKQWRHTYLYSGESYILSNRDEYTCVLYGQRNHGNTVNVPLYVSYLYCNNIIPRTLKTIPTNDIVTVIDNPNGKFRSAFLSELQKHIPVTHAGNFRKNTNINLSKISYASKEFLDYVGKFKFVVTMENSQEDTYITEKIMHGLMAGNVPIYWGSPRICDYVNSKRFIHVRNEEDFATVSQQLKQMTEEEWTKITQEPIFTEFGRTYTLEAIAKHIKCVLQKGSFDLSKVVVICNSDFEPQRYVSMNTMLEDIGILPHEREFICPTYKHLIIEDMFKKHVKEDLCRGNLCSDFHGRGTLKKSELSLILNMKAAYEWIERSYSDGIFLVLESDVFALQNVMKFNECLSVLKDKVWSCVSIGGIDSPFTDKFPFRNYPSPYRRFPDAKKILSHSKEDISSPTDKVRFIRKFGMRCCDSLLFSYKGIKQVVNYMNIEDRNFGTPFDYYLTQKTEIDMDFKFYWTSVSYFDQASNRGLVESTIQKDFS